MTKKKKLTPQLEAQMAEARAAFAAARANNCEHIDTTLLYDEKKDRWVDDLGMDAESPFPCDGCGGQFCSECFGRNKCKSCEADEAADEMLNDEDA